MFFELDRRIRVGAPEELSEDVFAGLAIGEPRFLEADERGMRAPVLQPVTVENRQFVLSVSPGFLERRACNHSSGVVDHQSRLGGAAFVLRLDPEEPAGDCRIGQSQPVTFLSLSSKRSIRASKNFLGSGSTHACSMRKGLKRLKLHTTPAERQYSSTSA